MCPVFSACHCVISLLSAISTWIPGHAGGWQLRKKPRVLSFSASSRLVFEHDVHVPGGFWQFTRKVHPRDVELWRSCIPRKIVHTFIISLPLAQFSTIYSGHSPGRARNVLHPGAFQCTLHDWLRTNHTNFLKHRLVGLWFFRCTYVVTFKPITQLTNPRLLLPLLLNFLCQAGYVNGNPSGSLLENRSENLLGGVDFYGWRLCQWAKSYEFPCAPAQHW